MKWTELLRKDNYALLQSESDTQYVVVSGYDPTQPEDQQWSNGTYFEYWNDIKRKADCLQSALNYLKSRTEEKVYGKKYEYTPREMAEKLMEFNRDFSDSAEDIQNEKEHVTELFEKLQNSNEFNILAHYLDTMFMDEVFNK